MPPRFPPFPISARLQQKRCFSRSSTARQEGGGSQNHYETLGIPVDASPAEVKKQFYTLSKTHHPDLNPTDPHASSRFVKINEAYATLRIPAKRREYDLTLPSHSHSHSHSSPRRTGSYASTTTPTPAGGRPASGLSRRRTQFRGAPESFYRNGGWGDQGGKRAEAQRGGAAAGANGNGNGNGSGDSGRENMDWKHAGMGHGQVGWGHGSHVPHFDKEGHFKSYESYEAWRRRKGGGASEEGQKGESTWGGSLLGQFLFVGGIVTLGVWVPGLVFERWSAKDGKKDK